MKFYDCFDILLDDRITLKILEKNEGSGDILPYYFYAIHENQSGCFAGRISIRIGDNCHSYYNGHIGYEIEPDKRGSGYAARASRLVLPVAKFHGMERIYITCGINNVASRKTIEKLGAAFVENAKIPEDCFFFRDGIEEYCIYKLEL